MTSGPLQMHQHASSPPPIWAAMKVARYSTAQILGHFGIREPPVPVFNLAEWMGVHLHFLPSPGWDGAVRSTEHHADIWVREDTAEVRQRFTVAHEIGHLLLHPFGAEFRDVDTGAVSHTPHEREANAFAAALLMPRFMLQPLLYNSGLPVVEMAQRFKVSLVAMEIRINWLRRGWREY